MDYQLIHAAHSKDPAISAHLMQKLDACARKLEIIPSRFRQHATWEVEIDALPDKRYRLLLRLYWPLDAVEVSREGDCLLALADEALADFRKRIAQLLTFTDHT
jgi:hypothetical protein